LWLSSWCWAFWPDARPALTRQKERPASTVELRASGSASGKALFAPLVFVVSLFRRDLSIYEVHNNGAWYNFGYLFGLACFFGGSGNRAPRRAVKSGTPHGGAGQ